MSDLQSFKEEVRSRADIVDVIGQYTRLKRAGKAWTGLCPFHSERNPSFSVVPELQIYKCFSCGETGDVFTFVQKKENLDFKDALELLARRFGVPLRRSASGRKQSGEREQLLEVNTLAARFFRCALAGSADARGYLAARGIGEDAQDRFQIGFAPDDPQALVEHLRSTASLAIAARAGLIRAARDSGFHTVFRNRLMFPIADTNGMIAGFGGRAMGEEAPRYLNSAQSPVFDKSRLLYGYYFARTRFAADLPAVLVEGYMDVISAHQAGYTQCVATLGTSITEAHARALSRVSPRVVVCYDSDTAGVKAALRAAEVWQRAAPAEAELRIARLPEGEDPDSLLRRGGRAAFQAAIDGAVSSIDLQIELALERHDTTSGEGRALALKEIVPILASIPAVSVRDGYAQQLAPLHPFHGRIEPSRVIRAILGDIEQHDRRRGTSSIRPPVAAGRIRPGAAARPPGAGREVPPQPPPQLTRAEKAERQILRALLSARWRSHVLGRTGPADLVTDTGASLWQVITHASPDDEGNIEPLAVQRLAEAAGGADASKLVGLLRQIVEDSPFLVSNDALTEDAVADCIRTLLARGRDHEKRRIVAELERSDALPVEQRRAYIEQYQRTVRAARSSADEREAD